jgi:hypothetical protein
VRAWSEARAVARSIAKNRRARRALGIGAIALFAALASYLVGMNVFLRTRLFRDAITSSSGSLLVDYRSAYSLWPGRIHVEGLVIRGRDSAVEWILLLDRCDFRVSLPSLARKRFHASHVNGDGLSLRVRLRRDGPVTPEEARALPPVPGFLDPPLADVGPPPPPLTDANYNLWSVDLEDVDANHVRELWIDTMRYSGDLEVRGRWLFRPLRWLDVGPATIDLRSLEVGYGMVEPWLSRATGELKATIRPFALQEVLGADMIGRVSVQGNVRGILRMTDVLGQLFEPPEPGVRRASHADDAPIDARIELDHGVLRPGTEVHVESFAAVAHAGPLVVEASVSAQARVDESGAGHLIVGGAALRASSSPSETLRARSLAAIVTSRDLDLARLGKGMDLQGSVDGDDVSARLDEVALAAPHISVAATSARVQSGSEPLAGNLTIESHAISVERKDVTGSADVRAKVVASESRSPAGRLDLSGSELHLRNAHASVKGARVDVASFEAHAPTLAFAESRAVGRITIEASGIDVPLSLVPNALLLLPKVISVESGRARASASATLDVEHMAATGEALVLVQGLRARLGEEPIDGELHVDVRARESDGATILSGSTLAFNGTVGQPPAPWWARATLPQALLDARSGLRFRGQIAANAKDASPLAAVVASSTAIPRWVLNAISTQGLVATGQLVVSPSTFQARSVTARAAGIDLGFELAELGNEQELALLLDVGVVSAGIDVSSHSKMDVLLFGAKPWFEKKTASLRAVERRYE